MFVNKAAVGLATSLSRGKIGEGKKASRGDPARS